MSFNIQTIPDHLAITGRIKSWLNNPADKLPVSCTSFTVEDSIEGKDGIDDSLVFTSYGLRNAQGVAVNLSKIRPAGTQNGKGLVASGPSSFALEYSLKNQVLRRGGTYKNGAVNLHLDYRHADVVDFVLMTREELPWAYRTLDVDDNFITHLYNQKINRTVYRSYIDPQTDKLVRVSTFYETALDAVLGVIRAGDLFLSKLKYDKDGNQLNSNVCVTDTTWVETTEGPKQVKELIDTPFTTVVNGTEYNSSSPLLNGKQSDLIGFFYTGTKPVYTLKASLGYELELTANHEVMTNKGLVRADELKFGDQILVNTLEKNQLTNYVYFLSLEYKAIEKVYDCTIEDIHLFPANGLIVSNCLEIYFKPKGSCTLSHINLGSTKPEEIPTAFKEGALYLCQLHAHTNVGNDGKYLSDREDRQVGLGVIGLANLLANEDVKYLDFVKALELVTGLDTKQKTTERAMLVASYIYAGYQEAAEVGRIYNMDRLFAVAPTATCAYQYTDKFGYTTTPEIAPPINVSVERDSSTFGTEIYYYPDNVETAEQVGYETFFRLNNVWQYMMNLTGLAHSISTNWWADKVEMNREFLQKWLDSYHMSLYYSLNVSTGTLDKSSVITLDDLEEGSTQNVTPACDLNKREPCIPCGE